MCEPDSGFVPRAIEGEPVGLDVEALLPRREGGKRDREFVDMTVHLSDLVPKASRNVTAGRCECEPQPEDAAICGECWGWVAMPDPAPIDRAALTWEAVPTGPVERHLVRTLDYRQATT